MTATTTAKPSNHNERIIDEFRANDGKVEGNLDGFSLLLLHHKGAKSGTDRVNPLAYLAVDEHHWAVFASKGGADDNPAWFYNVLANPDTTIEVGSETVSVRAYEAREDERLRIWTTQTAKSPAFAEYERKTARPFIPVMVLERV